MSSDKIQEYLERLMDWGIIFLPKVLMAVVILYVGLFIAKKVSKLLKVAIGRANLGQEVSEFLSSILEILLKVIVFMIAASVVGIELSALFGLLAAAGFAVGLALQGFLGNFAAGLTILFFKPYRIGDWVSVSDSFGKVKNIQIFNTTLETPNDKTLVIPNGQVTDNIITNFSTIGKIRLELNVTMPYAENFPKVEKVISEALKDSKYIDWGKAPLIGIEKYDSHNIVIAVRPSINPDDYWEATFEINSLIKKAFSENNIMAAYSEGVELGPIGA